MNKAEILLAEPRGFCAGVDRAIEIVERAIAKFGAPIYVRHEIVHNTYVVNDLKAKGAIFIEALEDVPVGATLVFSAHGVPKSVEREAESRGFRVFDATCPLVSKVHVEVAKLHKEGYEFIMIGHKGHPEVEGTMGQLDSGIHLVEDVADVARKLGVDAYMVDGADELRAEWIEGKSRIGLTAGASAPDILVRQVIERLRALGATAVRKLDGIEETVKFPLPKGLKLDQQGESQLGHMS